MEVYLEDSLVNNFLLITLVLFLGAFILKIKVSKTKFICVAFLCTTLNVFSESFKLDFKIYLLIKIIIISIVIILLSRKITLKKFNLYFLCFICVSIFMVSLINFISRCFRINFSLFYIENAKILLFCWLISLFIVCVINSISKINKISQFYYQIEITKNKNKFKATAYLDTGNILTDNISGKPVVIVDFLVLNKLLPKISFEDFILSKIKDEFGYYINYRTISGIGKIFIFKPDRVELVRNKKKIKLDIVLGVTIKGFEKGSDFNALLNPLAIS